MSCSPTTFVLENHRDCREALVALLETYDFSVLAARTGGEALAALREHTPKSLLINTALPDMHPLDVVRVLRANRRFDATTIVLVGTWLPPAVRAAAYAAGVNSVLLKPYLVDELLRKVMHQHPRTAQPV